MADSRPRIEYEFDAVPKVARERVIEGLINWGDYGMLATLIDAEGPVPGSCWLPPSQASKRTGRGRSSAYESYGRLETAKLIRIEDVPIPDPQEPRNRTGKRIYFTFMPESRNPDARISGERMPGSRNPERTVQKSGKGRPEIWTKDKTERIPTPPEREHKTKTTREDTSSSSSTSSLLETEDPAISIAVKAAAGLAGNPDGAVRKALREIENSTPAMITTACEVAKAAGKSWAYALGVVKNRAAEGDAVEPKAGWDPTHWMPFEGRMESGESLAQRVVRAAERIKLTPEQYLDRHAAKVIGEDLAEQVRRELASMPEAQPEPSEAEKAAALARLDEIVCRNGWHSPAQIAAERTRREQQRQELSAIAVEEEDCPEIPY